MAQVRQVQKQNKGGIGELITLGALAVDLLGGGGSATAATTGAAAAGGAATGAGLGAALATGGKVLGAANALSKDKPNVQIDAAKRRIGNQQTTEMPEPVQQLEQARMEVARLPQEQRQQFEPPILAALMKARRGQV